MSDSYYSQCTIISLNCLSYCDGLDFLLIVILLAHSLLLKEVACWYCHHFDSCLKKLQNFNLQREELGKAVRNQL